ncbi:MAG TPA: acylphosphatase [Pirellulales bacterium]|nr:acylphosphatase [Pirellulales bacterium]
MEPTDPHRPDDPNGPTDAAGQVRREIRFEGRVQGVGFRYTTMRIAGRFRVTGFVKNLPDGTVALVAEGAADEVERFQQAVEAELGRYITGSRQRVRAASQEYSSFEISF